MARLFSVFLAIAASILLAVGSATGERPDQERPPWACDQLEQPKLDRKASADAKPIPYKDPGWLFRMLGDFARAHPGAWASFYFDDSPRGMGNPIYFHVLLTKDVRHYAREITRDAKIPTAFRFSKAPVSLRELRSIARTVSREQFGSNGPDPYLGATPVYVAYDESENSVSVGLADYSAVAARAFQQRYGPRVCIRLRDAEPGELLRRDSQRRIGRR